MSLQKDSPLFNDFRRRWFASIGLPPSKAIHKQLYGSDIRQLLLRVQHRIGR